MNCLWMAILEAMNELGVDLCPEELTDDLYLAMEPRIGCHKNSSIRA